MEAISQMSKLASLAVTGIENEASVANKLQQDHPGHVLYLCTYLKELSAACRWGRGVRQCHKPRSGR